MTIFIKKYSFIFMSMAMLFLTSCLGAAPKKGEQTLIKSNGVSSGGVTLEVVGGDNLGLFLIGDPAQTITVTATNGTALPITGLSFLLSETVTAGMTFVPDQKGKRKFPGFGGTCSDLLPARQSCDFKITYIPMIQGVFEQQITFSYNDILGNKSTDLSLTVQAGEPASLVFTDEVTTYSFGVRERKDCNNVILQDLEIRNAGGLPATNLVWSVLNAPLNSVEGFKITENDCSSTLGVNQTCRLQVRFQPQNWGDPIDCDGDLTPDVAPDLDTYEVLYSAQLRADFTRDPLGGVGSLNGYFSTLSTTIEGRIEVSGLTDIAFDDPFFTAGQSSSKTLKLSNFGFKEAILRLVHVIKGGVEVATCVKNEVGTDLVCLDPADPTDMANLLSKDVFPFRLVDVSNCFDLYNLMNYTRDINGSLSVPGIRKVGGIPLGGAAGESCFVDINFEPSVIKTANGNLANPSDYEFVVEYDTTWKNLLDPILTLRGELLTDPFTFRIVDAIYKSPARAVVDTLIFDGNDILPTENKVIRYKSVNFDEKAANDGSIYVPIFLELVGDSFTWETSGSDEILSEGAKFFVANLPPGLGLSIKKVSKDFGEGETEHAEVSLSGNATGHGAGDSLSNLEISFEDSAFVSSTKGSIFHSTKSDLSISFIENSSDFAPDPGDPVLDVFVNLGRIALVNSDQYLRSLSFQVKNIGGRDGQITSVSDGKGASLTQGIYNNLTEANGTYYKSVGFDTDILATVNTTISFVTALNPLFMNDSAKEYGLIHDVNGGVNPIESYKKFEIIYTDGADINDDGSPRRPQKINLFWNAVLVKKGYLVIYDTGDPDNTAVESYVAGNINYYDLVLKNDGTGPVTYIKVKNGMQDLFDYNQHKPYSFVDDPTCDAPGCKDCFEIVGGPDDPWPSGAALDCAGADSSVCLNSGESCTMKIQTKVANAIIEAAPMEGTGEKRRDYSLLNELGASEKNWHFYHQGAGGQKTVSFEYLDGDHAGRTDEDIDNYGDTQNISGIGSLSNGEYVYDIVYRMPAGIIPASPKPIESSIFYRQAVTLPAIFSDSSLADVAGLTIPQIFWNFVDTQNAVNRGYKSRTHLTPLITGADDSTYDWIFHGGSFPYTGSTTYQMQFTLRNIGYADALDLSLNYTGPGNLSYSVGAYTSANFSGSVTVTINYTPSFAGEDVEGVLELSYENQQVVLGAPVVITKKIKIMASSTVDVPLILSSQEQDASLVPFGAASNYTLRFNSTAIGSKNFKDIRGGAGISHRYTLTNNSGASSLKDIALYIKVNVNDSSPDNTGIGHAINEPTGTPCSGINLAPGNSCEFDLAYTAPDSGSGGSYVRYLYISYAIEDNQYVTNRVSVTFEPAEPAILTGRAFPSGNALPTQTIGFPFNPDPYFHDFGINPAGNHVTIDQCNPMQTRQQTLLVRNQEVERASLLRAYRCNKCSDLGGYCKATDEQCYIDTPSTGTVLHDTATFRGWEPAPGGAPVPVYSSSDNLLTVTADRRCLYGATGVSPGEGFTAADGDVCEIYINWIFNKNQFGKTSIDLDSAFSLEFYSSQLSRRPTDKINFLVKAFVEPNPVTHAITNFDAVSTDSSGLTNFTFYEGTPDDMDCGDIDSYRIFYSDTSSALDNIWTANASYVDIPKTGANESVTINGLNDSSFYYFKVASIRTFEGMEYLSDSNLGTLGVLIPPAGSFYDHDLGLVFDDYVLPQYSPPSQFLTPTAAATGCSNSEYSLRKDGSNNYIDKQLIDEDMWDYILTDPDFTSYAGGDPWLFPHWLNEAPRPIAPYFPGYDCNTESSNTADNEYAYSKPGGCEVDDTLPLLVGRNLLILPFKYNFIEPNGSYYGFARCFAPVAP
jgi:hypothetical protein